jgi:hypothetical protein
MAQRGAVYAPLADYIHGRRPTYGLAMTSLLTGMVGLTAGMLPMAFWAALLFGLAGIGLGLLGLRHGPGQAGVILGCVAVILGVISAAVVNTPAPAPTHAASAPTSAISR